jgi:hypothetical protein
MKRRHLENLAIAAGLVISLAILVVLIVVMLAVLQMREMPR